MNEEANNFDKQTANFQTVTFDQWADKPVTFNEDKKDTSDKSDQMDTFKTLDEVVIAKTGTPQPVHIHPSVTNAGQQG